MRAPRRPSMCRPGRGAAVAALGLALWASAAAAQAGADEAARPFRQSRRVEPVGGLHYGTPLRWSLAFGALVDPRRAGGGGLLVLGESGLGGVRASLGGVRVLPGYGSGVAVTAGVLRTNGEPWQFAPRTTYAGVEARLLPILVTGVRVGVWRRIGGRPDGATRWSIGGSFGL